MKKLILFFAFAVLPFVRTLAYDQVTFIVNYGVTNKALKKKIEFNLSTLLSEINRAQEENISNLSVSGDIMTAIANDDLNQLWQHEHFRCIEETIVERCLNTRNGYQVRGIPLIVNTANEGEELGYQEAVINFDKNGKIVSFLYTANSEVYTKLRIEQTQNRKNEVTDIQDRMMILDYVEHFRTAYNQRDIHFLRQVFSNDALIITVNVIKTKPSEVVPTGTRLVPTVQTKEEYLNNLSTKVFNRAKYIKVDFDDVVIVEHPTIDKVYGVTVHQKWKTDRYSDEGYVFMMWDFRDSESPQIHVRTWQPDFLDKTKGERLNPEDVFKLGDFDLN